MAKPVPAQKPAESPEADPTPEQRAQQSGDPVFFEGTVTKIDKDGNEVLSDHLLPGERLRREDTDAYFHSPRSAQHENAVRDAEEQEKRDAAK